MIAERIHVRHLRAAKVCSGGGREWCARNGFSWSDFVSEGLPTAPLRSLNDAIVNRVIAEADKEAASVQR